MFLDQLKISACFRRYTDISIKLGGQEEAANAMGKLIRNVASRLADETSMQEVSPLILRIFVRDILRLCLFILHKNNLTPHQ